MDRIINTHDQIVAARHAGLPDVAIMARHQNGGRSAWRDGWKVWRPGHNLGTVKNRYHWDFECKVFEELLSGEGWRKARQDALERAQEWVRQEFGITEFARNRMGDYVDARVNEQFPLAGKR